MRFVLGTDCKINIGIVLVGRKLFVAFLRKSAETCFKIFKRQKLFGFNAESDKMLCVVKVFLRLNKLLGYKLPVIYESVNFFCSISCKNFHFLKAWVKVAYVNQRKITLCKSY